jgi:hypothetical protein
MNIEQWIEAHTENTPAKFVRCEPDDLRALFDGKVLVPVSLLQKKVISGFSDEYSIAFHDGWNELIDEIAASQEQGK